MSTSGHDLDGVVVIDLSSIFQPSSIIATKLQGTFNDLGALLGPFWEKYKLGTDIKLVFSGEGVEYSALVRRLVSPESTELHTRTWESFLTTLLHATGAGTSADIAGKTLQDCLQIEGTWVQVQRGYWSYKSGQRKAVLDSAVHDVLEIRQLQEARPTRDTTQQYRNAQLEELRKGRAAKLAQLAAISGQVIHMLCVVRLHNKAIPECGSHLSTQVGDVRDEATIFASIEAEIAAATTPEIEPAADGIEEADGQEAIEMAAHVAAAAVGKATHNKPQDVSLVRRAKKVTHVYMLSDGIAN